MKKLTMEELDRLTVDEFKGIEKYLLWWCLTM